MAALFRRNWKLLSGLVLVAAAAIFLYAPILEFEFLNYDDPYMVLSNPILFQDLGIEMLFKPIAGLYHPLTTLSLWTDLNVFGGEAADFHLTSLVLHVLAALALAIWAWRFTASAFVAVFLAAAFALHPTHVESVAWISERKDVLSALFFWIALIFHGEAVRRANIANWLLCFAFALMSLAAKPFALALPLLLPLIEWARTGFRDSAVAIFKRRWFSTALFLIVSVAVAVFNLRAQSEIQGTLPAAGLDAISRIPSQIAFYLGKTAWPWPLQILYSHDDLSRGLIWLSALGFLAALGFCAVLFRSHVLFGLGFFFLILAPLLKLVSFGDASPVSDRYLYVAQTGLWWPIAVTLGSYLRGRGLAWTKLFASALVLGLVGTWWWFAQQRLPDWRDSQSFWKAQLAIDPESKTAHENLGRDFASRDRYFEALHHFEKGEPTAENYVNRSQILLRFHRLEEANALLTEAETKFPGQIDIQIARADYWNEKGDFKRALAGYEAALAISTPETVSTSRVRALTSLGMLAIRKGDFEECLTRQNQALAILPRFANALYNRSLCLLNLNRLDDAEKSYRELLSAQPSFAMAYNDLGVIETKRGNIPQAKANFEHALRMDPGLTIARTNLNRILR